MAWKLLKSARTLFHADGQRDMVIYIEDYLHRQWKSGTVVPLSHAVAAAAGRLARSGHSRPALPPARSFGPAALVLSPETIDLPAGYELNTVFAEATLV